MLLNKRATSALCFIALVLGFLSLHTNIASANEDTTPPTVVGIPDISPNSQSGEDWYDQDVVINWSVSDPNPSSGMPNTPSPTLANIEDINTYTSGQSCDPAGNCATGSIEISIDKTIPYVGYTISPDPNILGWNNTNVTVSFICMDEPAGNYFCSDTMFFNNDGANQIFVGEGIDKAGNLGYGSNTLNIDKTPPTTSSVSMSGGVSVPLLAAVLVGATTNITAQVSDALSGVEKAEYYFDTDPGQGNASPMTVDGGQATANNVAIGSALQGLHTLYVRAKDNSGTWGNPSSLLFLRLL